MSVCCMPPAHVGLQSARLSAIENQLCELSHVLGSVRYAKTQHYAPLKMLNFVIEPEVSLTWRVEKGFIMQIQELLPVQFLSLALSSWSHDISCWLFVDL